MAKHPSLKDPIYPDRYRPSGMRDNIEGQRVATAPLPQPSKPKISRLEPLVKVETIGQRDTNKLESNVCNLKICKNERGHNFAKKCNIKIAQDCLSLFSDVEEHTGNVPLLAPCLSWNRPWLPFPLDFPPVCFFTTTANLFLRKL